MDEFRRLLAQYYGIRTDNLSDDEIRGEFERLVTRAAQRPATGIEPQTVNREAMTMTSVAATETPVQVPDYQRWEIVDEILLMSGCQLDKVRGGKLPLLDAHRRDTASRVLGSATNLRVSGEQLLTDEAWSATEKRLFEKSAEGHLDQRSIGYRVAAATYIEPGESAAVNGKTYTASEARALKVVTAWLPIEHSVVPIGADSNAGARSDDPPAATTNKPTPQPKTRKETPAMNPKLRALLVELGMRAESTDEEAMDFLQKPSTQVALSSRIAPAQQAPAAPQEPVRAPAAPPAVDPQDAIRAERERCASIRTAFAPFVEQDGIRAIMDTALESGLDVDKARAQMVEALGKLTPSAGRATITKDEADSRRECMESALLVRAMPSSKAITDDVLDKARSFRSCSLYDMAVECVMRGGVDMSEIRSMSRLDVVGAAFSGQIFGRSINMASGDFTNILANTANKVLLAGFDEAGQPWRQWCYTMSVSDFKTYDMNMLSGLDVLSEVPEGGAIPQHAAGDKKEQVTAKTYGNIFSITRQAVINDDLSAFTRIPMMQGMAWARTINRKAIEKLLANPTLATDSTALFAAGHSNLLEGTDYAPTTVEKAKAALNALKVKIRKQTGIVPPGASEGEALNLEPQLVLCGPTAEDYVREAIADTSTTDKDRTPNRGIRGLQVAVDPSLENSNITGYSATALYMFANQVIAPTVVVALLDGRPEPRLETRNGWSVEGVEYKVVGDAGFGVADHRGAALSTGVAAS